MPSSAPRATYYDGVVKSQTDLDTIARIKKGSKLSADYIVDSRGTIFKHANHKWTEYKRDANFSFVDS